MASAFLRPEVGALVSDSVLPGASSGATALGKLVGVPVDG